MKVISLFSGAGGMDLGFKQAGFKLIWANEIWADAAHTYRLNLGDHLVHSAIGQIDTNDIPNGDVVIGGFPCQGFSVANRNRHASDERNALYLEYLRVLTAKQPKFFFAENVKGLLSLDGGKVFEMIVRDFTEAGYKVQSSVLNAADYGVPQTRERVFIFGVRQDLSRTFPFPPPVTHEPSAVGTLQSRKSWVTIGDCLADIPEPDHSHSLLNHECTTYKLRFNGHQGHRIVNPRKPSPTITARGDERGGVVIHHHPSNLRRLSAREAALIQSFPIDYVFYGSKTSVYRQVANAVPPLLAKRVGEWLRDYVAYGAKQ